MLYMLSTGLKHLCFFVETPDENKKKNNIMILHNIFKIEHMSIAVLLRSTTYILWKHVDVSQKLSAFILCRRNCLEYF